MGSSETNYSKSREEFYIHTEDGEMYTEATLHPPLLPSTYCLHWWSKWSHLCPLMRMLALNQEKKHHLAGHRLSVGARLIMESCLIHHYRYKMAIKKHFLTASRLKPFYPMPCAILQKCLWLLPQMGRFALFHARSRIHISLQLPDCSAAGYVPKGAPKPALPLLLVGTAHIRACIDEKTRAVGGATRIQ